MTYCTVSIHFCSCFFVFFNKAFTNLRFLIQAKFYTLDLWRKRKTIHLRCSVTVLPAIRPMGICCSSGGDTGMMTWFLYSASSCRSCCCWVSASWCWWPRIFPSRPFSSTTCEAAPPRLCLKSIAATAATAAAAVVAPLPLLGLSSKGFMMALGMCWMTHGGPASGPTGLPGHGASRGVEQRPLGAAGDTDSGYISSDRWWLLSGSCDRVCRGSPLPGRGWWADSGGERLVTRWCGERERCRSSMVGGCWGRGSELRGGRRTVSRMG